MNAKRPAPAFGQHVEIAPRLRCLDDAETVFVARHIEVDGIIAGDLQKHSGIGSALIGLPGRMQKPGSEAETGRDLLAVANHRPDRL